MSIWSRSWVPAVDAFEAFEPLAMAAIKGRKRKILVQTPCWSIAKAGRKAL